jgi:endonuclease-3
LVLDASIEEAEARRMWQATLVMSYGWGKTVGICVDTHVHKISNRLKWVDTWANGKGNPERTRKDLESWMPRELW